MLYSPAESSVSLKAGENSVTIGSEGYDEWFVTQEDAVLGFSKPREGRIIVFSPADEMIYDSSTDAGDLYVTKGSYIECNGAAGDVFTVTADPQRRMEKSNKGRRSCQHPELSDIFDRRPYRMSPKFTQCASFLSCRSRRSSLAQT